MVAEMKDYLNRLTKACETVIVTNRNGEILRNDEALVKVIDELDEGGERIVVIGNGGSAAIASHVVADLSSKRIDATALNDVSNLTRCGNDFGYENVYSNQMPLAGDVLVAISSSGNSWNIRKAVLEARHLRYRTVVTFSGFDEKNPLRQMGDFNFWVPAEQYGIVELTHQIYLHRITDGI